MNAGEMVDKLRLVAAYLRFKSDLAKWERAVDDSLMVVRNELYQLASIIHRQANTNPRAFPDLVSKTQVFSEFLSRGRSRPKPEDVTVIVTPAEPIVPFSNGHDADCGSK